MFKYDKIIVKDINGNEVNVILNSDGRYSFSLLGDVIVEVSFKEIIENPKTGLFDIFRLLLFCMFTALIGFICIKKYNKNYEI